MTKKWEEMFEETVVMKNKYMYFIDFIKWSLPLQ